MLSALASIVPAIARAISPECEVVLHDNCEKPPRILAIGNGHVTGRKVGDLMTRVTLNEQELEDLREPLFNYPSVAPNGSRLRVTLIPIRFGERTIAYVALNFAIENLLTAQRVLTLLTKMETHPDAIKDTFARNEFSLTEAFDECLAKFTKPVAQLTRVERINLVSELHQEGVFKIRGAAKELALRLGISRAAIYEYLQTIRAAAPKGNSSNI